MTTTPSTRRRMLGAALDLPAPRRERKSTRRIVAEAFNRFAARRIQLKAT